MCSSFLATNGNGMITRIAKQMTSKFAVTKDIPNENVLRTVYIG